MKTPIKWTLGKNSSSTLDMYIRAPSMPNITISLIWSFTGLFDLKGIGSALGDAGGVNTGCGILAVDIKSPVNAIFFVNPL